MTNTKHAPFRLKYDGISYTDCGSSYHEITVEDDPCREFIGAGGLYGEAEYAARIVHAWNCHDELLEALERIADIEPDDIGVFHDIANAALAFAKTEE